MSGDCAGFKRKPKLYLILTSFLLVTAFAVSTVFAAGTGNINVVSSPSGASAVIYVHLREYKTNPCTTPCSFNDIPIGEHSISITKDGLYYTDLVTVIEGETSYIDAVLRTGNVWVEPHTPVSNPPITILPTPGPHSQQTGNIVVSAPAGATVLLDSKTSDTSSPPYTFSNVPAGSHYLVVNFEGQSESTNINVIEGDTAYAVFSASKKPTTVLTTMKPIITTIPATTYDPPAASNAFSVAAEPPRTPDTHVVTTVVTENTRAALHPQNAVALSPFVGIIAWCILIFVFGKKLK